MCLRVVSVVHKGFAASLSTSQPLHDVGPPGPLTSAVLLPLPWSTGLCTIISASWGADFNACTTSLGVHFQTDVNISVAVLMVMSRDS